MLCIHAGLEVIVIGGGVAGLKAAGDLQRGGAEVTVLEARDRWARFAGAQGIELSAEHGEAARWGCKGTQGRTAETAAGRAHPHPHAVLLVCSTGTAQPQVCSIALLVGWAGASTPTLCFACVCDSHRSTKRLLCRPACRLGGRIHTYTLLCLCVRQHLFRISMLCPTCRLGGRIHTHTLRAGNVERSVDLGATFVCGAALLTSCVTLAC